MTPAQYNQQLPMPGLYAAGWRSLLDLPADAVVRVPGFIIGMHGWGQQTIRAGEALHFVRQALHDRINARAEYLPREPRETTIALWRDSRRVLDILLRRVRVYQFETKTARSRFAHLLASRED